MQRREAVRVRIVRSMYDSLINFMRAQDTLDEFHFAERCLMSHSAWNSVNTGTASLDKMLALFPIQGLYTGTMQNNHIGQVDYARNVRLEIHGLCLACLSHQEHKKTKTCSGV